MAWMVWILAALPALVLWSLSREITVLPGCMAAGIALFFPQITLMFGIVIVALVVLLLVALTAAAVAQFMEGNGAHLGAQAQGNDNA